MLAEDANPPASAETEAAAKPPVIKLEKDGPLVRLSQLVTPGLTPR